MANKDWIGTGADRLTFGERLGDLINSRGITQSQLAEDTGVNQSALSDYINKDKAPTCATIIALAGYFSVSTDYLLGLTAVKTPSTDTQAIVSRTGLTEDNVRLLGLLNVTDGPHIALANDFLSFSLNKDEMAIKYLQMKAALDTPAPTPWFDMLISGEVSWDDFEKTENDKRKHGYVEITGQEAFEYYCSEIGDAVEKALIDKYKDLAKWSKP